MLINICKIMSALRALYELFWDLASSALAFPEAVQKIVWLLMAAGAGKDRDIFFYKVPSK